MASLGESTDSANTSSHTTIFDAPPPLLPDPTEALIGRFMADNDPAKINLGIGAYRTDERLPYRLPSVLKAEKLVVSQELAKEYLPFHGLAEFTKASIQFCLGEDAAPIVEERICSFQTISGTGALRIGAEFLADFFPLADWYIPDPSWVNHSSLFRRVGIKVKNYRYLNKADMSIDMEGLLQDLESAADGSVVLLHLCAHNPTGVDLSNKQWDSICKLFQRKKLFAFFDAAYQGFASGDPVADSYGARAFADAGLEFAVAQSYSKIAGLYGERVGCLSVVCKTKESAQTVYQQIKNVVRFMYLSPPTHGARVMHTIFSSPELRKQWLSELSSMVERMNRVRRELVEQIRNSKIEADFSHLERQVGMFAFTGLPVDKIRELQTVHHIYMSDDGRISIAGLSSLDIPHIVAGLEAVLCRPEGMSF